MILRVAGHEPAGEWVVVSGAQVIQAEIGVPLLAAIEVIVGRGAG